MATNSSYIVYLHGFKSSPASSKAQQAKAYFLAHYPGIDLLIPQLPPEPDSALELVHSLIAERGESTLLGFIGSSLGGYYSIYLAHQFRRKAVLINPAIRPYDLLQDYLGINENFHTGEQFEVKAEHMESLRRLKVERVDAQESFYLLTQAGDETLDFREALSKLPKAQTWIWPKGSHEFEHFDQVLASIAVFFEAN